MVGAFGEVKADDGGLAKVAEWQSLVETHHGSAFSIFEVVNYMTQVVAGTNWKAKIKVSDIEYIHVKIYEKLPHVNEQPDVTECHTGKTLEDPL